ncbi:MAG: HAD family hydrolase [Ignavibacteria bacterium]|nr:HAD family hydrolase [Ignavibacteria bacterium]
MEFDEFKRRLKKVKLIVSDVDGTLLNKDYQLTELCHDMVNRLKEKAILFSLATQRIHSSIVPLAKELSIKIPIITLNGALIQDVNGENVIHRSHIKGKVVDKTLKLAEKYYIRIALCHDDKVIYTEDNSVFRDFLGSVGVDYVMVDSYKQYTDKTNHIFLAGNDRDVISKLDRKIGFRYARHVVTSRFRSQIHTDLHKLEIMPAKVTKKTGMAKLAKHLGIKKEELVVIGDWYNDRELFEYGGLNVTLKDAIPELKDKAHYISPLTNDEDAVGNFLKLFYDNMYKN